MLKILHVATDEKFINAANFIFEKAFINCNTFFIVQPPANPAIKYVKVEKNFEIIVQNESTINTILNKASAFNLIVFHGYDTFKAALFLQAPNKEKYLWMLWGAEVYNQTILNSNFLGIKTQALFNELAVPSFKEMIVEKCKNYYRKLKYKGYSNIQNVSIKAAIYNTPSMGILYKEEFDYFKNANVLKQNTTFVPFTYYPLEFIFKDENLKIKGNGILLGNSASYTNNHIEAIDLLATFNLGSRQVYIPLSYGSTEYANKVIDYANKKIPLNYTSITEFLPLHQYNELISNCGIVIMNHYRQQAVGNILAALFLGAKVFLNNTTIYQYLKRIGCIVFLIDDYLTNQQYDTFNVLSNAEVEHNRKILQSEIGINTVVHNLQNAIYENFNCVI